MKNALGVVLLVLSICLTASLSAAADSDNVTESKSFSGDVPQVSGELLPGEPSRFHGSEPAKEPASGSEFRLTDHVFSNWRWHNTALELGFAALMWQDATQTRHVARNPQDHSEKNPILGEHPKVSAVNTYFITTGVLHALVAWALPPVAREIWQVSWIGIQYNVTTRNANLGIRGAF